MDKIYEFYYDPRAPWNGCVYELQIEHTTQSSYMGAVYFLDADGSLKPRGNFRLGKDQIGVVTLTYRHHYLVRVIAEDYYRAKKDAIYLLRDHILKWAESITEEHIWDKIKL